MPDTKIAFTQTGFEREFILDDTSAPNRIVLVEQNDHLPDSRVMVTMTRGIPKVNGNSRGTRKTSSKITVDVTVPNADGSGTITVPAIASIEYSLPLGMSETQETAFMNDATQLQGAAEVATLATKQVFPL